jgi:hypothetical protein
VNRLVVADTGIDEVVADPVAVVRARDGRASADPAPERKIQGLVIGHRDPQVAAQVREQRGLDLTLSVGLVVAVNLSVSLRFAAGASAPRAVLSTPPQDRKDASDGERAFGATARSAVPRSAGL